MMNMSEHSNEFHTDDLITWHDFYGNKCIPVAGVVIRQEPESILIKARIQGAIKEVHVSPKELVIR